MNHAHRPAAHSDSETRSPCDRASAARREPRKFLIALLAGMVAAATVDIYFAEPGPTVAAAVAVPRLGPLETLPVGVLCHYADDADPMVRRQAVDELGRRGAVAELAQLLGHPRQDVRQRIPQALLLASQAAHDQIPLLATALESADETTRNAAAEALLVLVRARGPYRGPDSLAKRPAANSR